MKAKKEKDKKTNQSQEYIARMRATNTILEQHKKIKIIQFLNIADNSLHPECSVNIDEPIFKPEPNVILFQDYEPLQIKQQILKLRNRDIVPRRVQIITPETRLFQVLPTRKGQKLNKNSKDEPEGELQTVDIMNTKVAPGMEVSYLIRFTPEAKIDVSYDLIVITEREKFIVPIRGIGCKVMIEFMDNIDFGDVPVKYRIEKPIILRNVGEKITKWMLKVNSPHVIVSKKEGILDIGKSEQIICTFCPLEDKQYIEEMILTYDEFEAKITVRGRSKNDDVKLSRSAIKLEDAYITLHSQAFMDIINKSTVPVDFVWKQYLSKEKEDEAKNKVFENLNRQEAEEKILNELAYDYEEIQGDRSFDIDDSYDEEELIKISERNHLKNLNIIARRFEKIKKSLNEDQMFFDNPNFQIEPLSGKIWPNSSLTICLTFKPDKAIKYSSEAFCDVTGLDKRIKLDISGTGIGPKAKLSFYEKNLFDVYITETKYYESELVIQNTGVIPCEWEIEPPNTPCAKQFKFEIERGKLQPRSDKDTGEMAIPFRFEARRLGEFTEKFNVKILKSNEKSNLSITFKGHVVAPTCFFSEEKIDFEKVSPGFKNIKKFYINNSSRVNINYELRISSDFQDQELMQNCFILKPCKGILKASNNGANGIEEIEIEFHPENERTYEIVVLMDMTDIGYDMLTLPVCAVCDIPTVKIEPADEVQFETVFIRDEVTRTIKLNNESDNLSAKFEVKAQEEITKTWAIVKTNVEKGEIDKKKTALLNVTLTPLRLGPIRIRLDIKCKTKNSTNNNTNSDVHSITLSATSIGPIVKIMNLPSGILDFDKPQVLVETSKTITLLNDSPIEAEYTAFMRDNPSIFNVNKKKGKIPKKGTVDLEIFCRPDEAQWFEEKLYFKIEDRNDDLDLTLRCIGDGSTVKPEEGFRNIDFNTIFTKSETVKTIFVENRGRKSQKIVWQRKLENNKKKPQEEKNKPQQRRDETEEKVETFRIDPPSKIIFPKKGWYFKIIAMSNVAKDITEKFVVNNYVEGSNSVMLLGESVIRGNFIKPELKYDPRKLSFKFNYETDINKTSIDEKLTFTNISKLRAEFSINCKAPFYFSQDKFIIEPDQSDSVIIKFDPSVNKEKKKIDNIYEDLIIQHTNHETTDKVELWATIQFPNLEINKKIIDFGYLLNDTYQKRTIELDNKSEMKVEYEFLLLEDPNSYEVVNNKKKEGKKIPLNEVFSIVPMNGSLAKGEKEIVEVTFLPGLNSKYTAKVKCSVVGGPDYFIDLIGAASEIIYKINVDKDNYDMNVKEFDINFEEVGFNEKTGKLFTIKNEGKVNFFYKITYKSDKIRYMGLTSTYDEILKGTEKGITVDIIPGTPDIVHDYIILEIAHCEPVKINIKAVGIYKGAVLGLTRKEPDINEKLEFVSTYYEQRKQKILNYLPQNEITKKLGVKKNTPQTGAKQSTNLTPDLRTEYEIEHNRKYLSDRLLEKIEKNELSNISNAAKDRTKPQQASEKEKVIASYLKEMKISSYVCNFGNIIAGDKQNQTITIFNYNKQMITITIDRKELSQNGYLLITNTMSDTMKIEPGSMLPVEIIHETKKGSKLDMIRYTMKIFLKDLEWIELELISNVTIPDFKFTNNMVNSVEFGKVFIGRKKIVRFRIENFSVVSGNWSLVCKDPPLKKSDGPEKKEDLEVFEIDPQKGSLEPNTKKTITVSFIPIRAKAYVSRYNLVIEKNPNQKEFMLKGSGADLSLEIVPVNYTIGPVLPYYKYALGFFELKNNNDIDIEVYSLDYDKQFSKEEDIIRNYKSFLKKPTDIITMPVRPAGQSIWDKFEKFNNKLKDKIEKMKIDIKQSADYLGYILAEEDEDEEEVKFPQQLEKHNKYNIILVGPEKTGKSSLCKEQQKHHFRGIVSIADIYEWNEKNGYNDTIQKAIKYLDEKKKELEIAKVEREKFLKANKNKKPKVDPPAFDEKKYNYLSKEIMIEMLKNRLSKNDCAVGAIFDNITNKYVENEEILMEIIDETLQEENIILCTFEYSKDHMGYEVCQVVNWNKFQEEYRDKIGGKSKIDNILTTSDNSKNKSKNPQSGKNMGKKEVKSKETKEKNSKENKEIAMKDSKTTFSNNSNQVNQISGKNQTLNLPGFEIPQLTFTNPKILTKDEKMNYEQLKERLVTKFMAIKEMRDTIYEEQQIKQQSSIQVPNKSQDMSASEEMENNVSEHNQSHIVEPIYPAHRIHKTLEIQYHLRVLLDEYLKEELYKPQLPDPEDLPIPPDEEYQLIRRPAENKVERSKLNTFFLKSVHKDYENLQLDEIIKLLMVEDKKIEEIKLKEALEAKEKSKNLKKTVQPAPKGKGDVKVEEVKPKEILIDKTRWIIPRKESVRVLVGFFSKEVGSKTQSLGFEIMNYPTKEEKINLTGISDYPIISQNPNNMFMGKQKSGPMSLKVKKLEDDFGYLLITKDADKLDKAKFEKYKDTNCHQLRLTNAGKFDLRVEFHFLSALNYDLIVKEEKTPFFFMNDFLEIKKEETQILNVYAFPQKTIEYKDELICLIQDNPTPVRVQLSCKGAEPKVEIGPDILEFEKLIVNQNCTKQIKLKNVSEVNCKWQLNGLQVVPAQFKFDNISGVVEKGKEYLINVDFCSEKQEKFAFTVTIDIEDNLGYGVKQPPKQIKITAEAFKINVELIYNNDQKILDFGSIRVKDYKNIPLILKNLGIYKIKYRFEIYKKAWKEWFRFEPNEGEIEPAKDKTIMAIFLPYPKEVNLTPTKGTEIRLLIFEGEKNIKNQEPQIFVNVNTLFSKYSMNPPKGLNFGSIQYNENLPRSIEIRNDGQFEFQYEITEYFDEATMKKLKDDRDNKELEDQKLKEQEIKDALDNSGKNVKKQAPKVAAVDKDKGKKGKEDGSLKIDRFTIVNPKGIVGAGQSIKIDIIFNAEGNKFYNKNIAINIHGRHPHDNELGIPYDLSAESCIPGIETKDYDMIFEEHTVLETINPEINKQKVITTNIYSIQEKVFWFGTIIASKKPDGVTERFKLINPNKIVCNVNVSCKQRTSSKSEGFAFKVLESSPIKIYPHESKYISVTFTPTNVISYSGIFEAIVEGGDNETGVLRFELRGEGTLPSLVVDSPQEFDETGTTMLKFKRTRVTKSLLGNIVLRNDGTVPATVKFEPILNECFQFLSTTTATIQAKNYQSFEIKFEPKNAGIEKAFIQYKTLHNPYEAPKLALVGEGFIEPVSFENLLNDIEINFGDLAINEKKSINFDIQNYSDVPMRFNWLNNLEPTLEFSISSGILLPKQKKNIIASLNSKETVKYLMKDIYCEFKSIKFSGEMIDWDNSMKFIRKISNSEFNVLQKKKTEDAQKRKDDIETLISTFSGGKKPAGSEKKPPPKDAKKIVTEELKINPNEEANIEYEETYTEPAYTIIEKSEKYNLVKLTAVSDYVRFDCPTKEIRFKPTQMYASRTQKIQIKNLSTINMNYNFDIINPMTNLRDFGPYSVSPQAGIIPAGSDDTIIIKFSPIEVDDLNYPRNMVCGIKSADPTQKPLAISLLGYTERPVCHFELSGGVKHDNDVTILEFDSIGMAVKNTKKFFVLNPTNLGYEFDWEQLEEESNPNKIFKCITSKGVIYSGKKFEMVFEYTPVSLGQQEDFWMFKIPTEKIFRKFKFVGIAREPLIIFNQGKVNFGPLLLGGRIKEIVQIINEEHLPFKFLFDKDSIKGQNSFGDSLIVSPIAGTLQPNSSTPIEITFMPRVERDFNYNLIVKIKQRQKPLVLNVKGVGYTINHSVFLDTKPDLKLMAKQEHSIDFGDFFVNEKRERTIFLENSGNFNFHYLFKKNAADYLKITPDNGTVNKGKKANINLTLLPLSKINLKNHKIIMQIISGPTYTFLLNANANTPKVNFSFTSFDFGPVYVMRQPTPVIKKLQITNLDKEALTIETLFDNKNKSYLDVNLSPGQVILPGQNEILEVPIVFIPREFTKYREVIKFNFNGIYEVDVEIKGEGIPLRLELEDPNQQSLDFGILLVGQDKKMEFKLINKGRRDINVLISPENSLNFAKKCLSLYGVEKEKDKEKVMTVKPRDTITIGVRFNPSVRIPAFKEDLVYKIDNNETRKLMTVSGASYGVDMKIMGNSLFCGTVVINSMTTHQVQMKNLGDLSARFKWETPSSNRDYTKFFTITPSSGAILPHEDLFLRIDFHPTVVDNNINFENIKCLIENSEPLFLTLRGSCTAIPNDSKDTINIETEVRVAKNFDIKIKNPTNKPWRIQPTISSNSKEFTNYFKGDTIFEIKENSEGTYSITYLPLTMSRPSPGNEKGLQHGSVFFPLPDGNAKLKEFWGIATQPKPKMQIQETAKARDTKVINLDIQNWLYTTQRFKVTWQVDKTDPAIFIRGANTIDVPPNNFKPYKLTFLSWKQMVCNLNIRFENVETGEYIFYLIAITVQPAENYSVTELFGPVREIVSNNIIVKNPLKISLNINEKQISCDNDYVVIKPNSFTIIPESEIPLEVFYRPLLPIELKTNIKISTPELGELLYPLLLKGLPLNTHKALPSIQTFLGSEKIETYRFLSYSKKPTDYTVKIEKYSENLPNPSDFVPEPVILKAVASDPMKGYEITGSIRYVPYNIGTSRAILKVSSPDGGEYTWVLHGECSTPQPQGPLRVPLNGKPYVLDFKNPLIESAEVTVRFDNQNFSLGTKLNPKYDGNKPINISIVYKAGQDQSNTGRITITLNKLPPWIYYLQAE